jgi:hypothetical protein
MTLDKTDYDFINWERETFGAGYGTGELPIMEAVKTFFDSLDDLSYNYIILEDRLGSTVTWLLINAFEKKNIIEWGSSARFGWLTSSGIHLRNYIRNKTPQELYNILMACDETNFYTCLCNGEAHEECAKNPMLNGKYANSLRFKI